MDCIHSIYVFALISINVKNIMLNMKDNQYVLLLDASKAFDHVCYGELLNILIDKKYVPAFYNCYVTCISIRLVV